MFIIFIIPIPTFAQDEISCGSGLIRDNSTGQCILECGEGTVLEGKECKKSSLDIGQLEAIAVGIIGGLIATAFGILWTIKTRREEREKEDLEIIQNYGNQISEITTEEKNLETQLDCSLYAERYLDILNQMASLLHKHLIRPDVADYFEKQFKYGINLWFWYHKNIERISDVTIENNFVKEINPKKSEHEQERWGFFRWWCNHEEAYNKTVKKKYKKFESKEGQSEILPDTMESDFEDIPDENGMSKFEVVETIQKFGEILNNISTKEKNLYSKLDCTLYVEQYLDTLEQICSLYRKRVIPKKAADYFENKFAYGINLLDWYNKFVNKENPFFEFDPLSREMYVNAEKEDRWSDFKWFCRGGESRKNPIYKFKVNDVNPILPDLMKDYESLPNEEGLKPNEVLEIMRSYSKQLTDLSGKETELKTKIDCSVYVEQYLDTLEQIAYLFNKKAIATDAVTYFENNFAYGLTLKEWYDLAVIGAKEQENRWAEIEEYCASFKDENDKPKPIQKFNIETTLPTSMLYYNDLPTDICQKEYDVKPNYKI